MTIEGLGVGADEILDERSRIGVILSAGWNSHRLLRVAAGVARRNSRFLAERFRQRQSGPLKMSALRPKADI